MSVKNPVAELMAKKYPHEISDELRKVLREVIYQNSPNGLKLQQTDYRHALKHDNWNYLQVSVALNNFWNLSAAFIKGVSNGTSYDDLADEVARLVELWNRDVKPKQEELARMNKIANPGGMKVIQAEA